MCRFNLIIIKDTNNDKAVNLLKKDGYGEFTINMPGHIGFQKGYCNCGSFIGDLIEMKGIPYSEVKEIKKQEELKRLYQVKNLMLEPNYQANKAEFNSKCEMLSKKLEPYFHQMENDVVVLEETINNESIQAEDNQKESFKNMEDDYVRTLEALPGYMEARNAYQTFIKQNDIMNDSIRYFTSIEEEAKFYEQSIPLSELLKDNEEWQEEEVEIIGMDELMQSNVIDEVISRTIEDTYCKELEEFGSYCQTIKGVLQHLPSLHFTTIWSEPKELIEVKKIDFDHLTIDDFAYLDYDEMVCIKK